MCVDVPWSLRVSVLKLKKPLVYREKQDVDLNASAWGLELRNGAKCLFREGMTGGSVAGVRITYICDDGGEIIGRPDRGPEPWIANYSPSFTSEVDEVEVDIAWY